MMKKIIFFFVIATLLMSPLVASWGPHMHNRVIDLLKINGANNAIVQKCLDDGLNEKSFRGGAMTPDITVTKYYTDGGRIYKLTHNWNFAQEIFNQAIDDEEICFAYGISLVHLIPDAIAHTEAVPNKIKKTRVPNWLAHPLLEKKYDSELLSQHPELGDKTRHMLDVYFGPKGDRYVEMIENAMGSNIDFDVRLEIDNLAFALDTFYDDAFAPRKQDNSFFIIYPYIDKLTNFIHPLVGKWNVKDINFYEERNAEVALSVLENWGSRYSYSPHGFSELQEADAKASFVVPFILIALLAFSVLIPLLLIIVKKKFRYAFLFLLIIPIMILAVAIIYIIL